MKSVYSLVLMDDVVGQVDRLAYAANTSRSNMINRILAAYVSYETPEQRIREAFSCMERLLTGEGAFQLLLQPSDSMLSLRSAIAYKYNPTVRYCVELYRAPSEEAGELRVSLRSRNAALLGCFAYFFRLWNSVELRRWERVASTLQSGRYARRLLADSRLSSAQQGERIAGYLGLLDGCMKLYFGSLDEPERAARAIQIQYNDFFADGDTVL